MAKVDLSFLPDQPTAKEDLSFLPDKPQAEDLSFLPDQPKGKVDLSFLPDQPKGRIDLSFLPDQPKNKPQSLGKTIIEEGVVKPAKTFYSGVLKASANFADTLDFYSDKIAKTLNLPETKNSIFEFLKTNWDIYGKQLEDEGVTNKLAKAIYSGVGQATVEVPKLMTAGKFLGAATLPVAGAVEGGKTGDVGGAAVGAVEGALTHGIIKGLQALPAPVKYPAAFGAGAVTTPGGIEEKVAGGAIFSGLSAGKSPSMEQFKKTQSEFSPLAKIITPEKTEGIYQNFVNRFQSIENIVDKAKSLGATILPGEDPALRARSYLGVGQKVKTILEDKTYRTTPEGNFEITGEGLKPILKDYETISPEKNIKLAEKDLNDYLISQRTIKDLQRPKSEFNQENIATPEQVKNAQDTINTITQKYGGNIQHLDQTATRLYDYQKRVLHSLVDSGNMSEETYLSILNKNPNYVPFDRVIEGVEPSGGTPISKNRFTGARSPIKKIKGSELEIHNPIESIIKNTYRITDIAERNTIARGVANLKDILPEDISPVKIPMEATYKETMQTVFGKSPFKPKGNVIEYFDNGNKKYMEVTPNLYQAMTGLNETSLGLMAKILQHPAGWLRTGATITPEFMPRNLIRDQWTAFMQTKLGFKPFIDTSGAIADILGKSEVYNDWLRSGGAYSGFVELSRPNLQKMVNNLQAKPNLIKNLNIISKAQDISQLFEQATRLGVYKAGIKKGLSPVEAGFESRESTLDFARRGAQTKDLNASIAFFNAGIQSADKLVRTAKEDPAGFAAKGIASITIPSLLLYLKNRQDPEYKEQPRWLKDMFWITKVGNTWIRIPKPFAYGQFFGSVPERFFEYLDTQDPTAFNKLEKSLYDSLSPISGDPASGLMATGIKPLIENTTNWNFFTQRPIVSESKGNLLPEYQTAKNTSETAKAIGKTFKYSPAKIENLVGGLAGGSGRYALELGDLVGKGINKLSGGKQQPEKPVELSDIPLVKGFVTRSPYENSESVNKFYDNKKQLNEAYTSYNKLLKEGNQSEANKIKKEYPNLSLSLVFNQYGEILNNYEKQIDNVIKSDKTDKEKRLLINAIERKKTELSQKANRYVSGRR